MFAAEIGEVETTQLILITLNVNKKKSFRVFFSSPVVLRRIDLWVNKGKCINKNAPFPSSAKSESSSGRKHTGKNQSQLDHFPLQSSTLLVCLHSQQGTNHRLSWKFSAAAETVLEELAPLLSMSDISHLCLSRTHCPPRGLIMVAVSSLGCWASVRDGMVGFHFHLATLHDAKVGTNEHCWSVCSCSGAHKLTLFIDSALHSVPICCDCSLSLLNKYR